MGDHFSNNGNGRTSTISGEQYVPGYSNWTSNIVTKRPRSTNEKMRSIADITFHVLGIGFIASDIITKVNGYLNAIILVILAIYFGVRSYIRLRRDYVALKREMFEQEQRELNSNHK